MAIVNGVYVPENVGDPKALAKDYFGYNGRRDMADYSQAALQIKLKELENQFNLDVWNMQNEYNTPAAQMLRYQDAGLNPNLIYGQSNMAGDIKTASAAQPRSSGNYARNLQASTQIVGQMLQAMRTGKEMFDYVKYGMPMGRYQSETARAEMYTAASRRTLAQLDADWAQFLANGPSEFDWEKTPKYKLWKSQKDSIDTSTNRVKALIGLIGDQQAREQALKAIDDYRLKIMEGQNDAVLNINTKYDWLNQVLRFVAYWAYNKSFW